MFLKIQNLLLLFQDNYILLYKEKTLIRKFNSKKLRDFIINKLKTGEIDEREEGEYTQEDTPEDTPDNTPTENTLKNRNQPKSLQQEDTDWIKTADLSHSNSFIAIGNSNGSLIVMAFPSFRPKYFAQHDQEILDLSFNNNNSFFI